MMAPLSASVVTSARPRLRFAPEAGSPTDVQICADRACTEVVWEGTTDASEVAPTIDLAPGYWFWRVEAPSAAYPHWTAPWLFRVRRRAPDYAPAANTAAEPFADYNGDGYPDAAVSGDGQFSIYLGGPDGLSLERVLRPDAAGGLVGNYGPSGPAGSDLDGDGYTDFGSPHFLQTEQQFGWYGLVQRGEASGLSSFEAIVTLENGYDPLGFGEPLGIGDVDGDGFGDLIWPKRYGAYLLRGCYGGAAPMPWSGIGCGNCQLIQASSGDFDGDGRFDFVYGDGTELSVYLGGTTPPAAVSVPGAVGGGTQVLDVDYDGYSDLLTPYEEGLGSPVYLFPGGPSGLAAQPLATPLPFWPVVAGDFDGDGRWDFVTFQPSCQEPCLQSYTTIVHYGLPSTWGAPFAREETVPVMLSDALSLLAVDLNADGYDDLLVSAGDGTVTYWAGSPAGLTPPAP
jgi:hypothetical protein